MQKPLYRKKNYHNANNDRYNQDLFSISVSPEIFVIETSDDLPWNPVIFTGINCVGTILTKNSIYLSQSPHSMLFNKYLEM